MDEAVEEAWRDLRPLMKRHSVRWFLALPTGTLSATCGCSPDKPRNWDAMATHLIDTVAAVRGPLRPPKPPKKA
jgi:hypothetical protein